MSNEELQDIKYLLYDGGQSSLEKAVEWFKDNGVYLINEVIKYRDDLFIVKEKEYE